MVLGKRKRDAVSLIDSESTYAKPQAGIHIIITSSQYDLSGAA